SGPQVSAAELEQVVRRDGVPFDVQSIPDEVLDRLASHRVVVVGEIHFLREHRELVAELLRSLHERGFRQFLFEWTQVADWLLADFVNDGGLVPGWAPPPSIGGEMIAAIRDFNRTLPEDERIQVHAIDVTLADYGGGQSFLASLGALSPLLPDPGPLSALLQGPYDTHENQEAQLQTLQAELESGRSALVASWGEQWYDTVAELVEVELTSVSIRAIRESNYDKSVRLREDAIKQLVDRRLQKVPHGTLINVGSTHAQKERLYGTDIEWLGDYLVHKSPVADGSVIVLNVSAAHIAAVPGSGNPDYTLSASPENELNRVVSSTWADQTVFLPLDDPLFEEGRVPISSDGTIYKGALQRHFDAFILLPFAQRVPSTD
ncbi:MAG TPA: hypothetical protein VM537_00790, partial [Anaerolineae bacterium]|nr:hypothetical protein [Anaerolineae bacterium]